MRHRASGNWKKGFGLSLLTTFMWGWLAIALKIGVERLDPVSISWCRFFGAAVILGLYLAAGRTFSGYRTLTGLDLRMLIGAALCLAANYGLYVFGLASITPSAAQLIIQLAPILVSVAAVFLFRERFSAMQWIGLVCVTSGLGLFFGDQLMPLTVRFQESIFGAGMVFLAALTWAAYALTQKQLLTKLKSFEIMFAIYLVSAVVFAPFVSYAAIIEQDILHRFILVLVTLNTLVAYGAFAEAMDHWDASRVGAVLALTPVFTLVMMNAGARLWPEVLAPEPISKIGALGALVVVTGSMLCALGRERPSLVGGRSLSDGGPKEN